MEKRIGVCNLCEAICGLELTVEADGDGERVTAVRGNPADPLSRGHICPKGVAIADIYHDPDRLRRPVRRVPMAEGAQWVEIEWEEAFDLVADELARVVRDHGADALGVYLGNPNSHSLGFMTHGIGMVKSLGTRNRFSATSVDQLPHQVVAHLMLGHQMLLPVPDLDRTSFFLVVGANPMASNGSLMTAPDFPRRLRDLKARGGRMVVLDPRRTETAKAAAEHVFVRPGSDAFVLLAMLQVLFAEGLVTVPAYADDVEEVRAAVAEFTPERAELRSGVPADTVRRLARELAAAESGVVYGRVGVSTHPFGSVCVWAITCLNALTGHLDREGGAMFTSPAIDAVGTGLIGPGHFDLWRSRVSGLPESASELPVAALREEIDTPGPGQIRAMLTIGGNPVLSTPDGAALDRSLGDLEFMVAVDPFVNETTRHADVILPPTTILERDHYDVVFHLLAVRNTARFTPAVLAKDPGGLHDWEIFRELGLRLSSRLPTKMPLKKRLALQARLRTSPTRLVSLLLRRGGTGVTLGRLRATPEGIDLGPLQAGRLPEALHTPDKRLRLAPSLVLEDLARLDEVADPEPGQLVLIGRRHQRDCNSWLHNTERLTRGRPRHQLLAHPDDLAARGIPDGSRVRISSRVGAVETDVVATEDMMPGVVSLPHGYGHDRPGVLLAHASNLPGVSLNDLTDPRLLDVSGNAALTGVPVNVSPA
ncbi:MAG TPA: molybdopterin-dependent oxidoreductase [Nocardioides sp.]|uniref:molybdopterin-dependent oxidoreductase n=1 Tax=Nocardioides sp. TaxID=35761 RepID=UPI002CD8EFAB|nr:molybdopterin-dependent oxidoreductase [Nocardioides sp.]HQR26715.1 molybdopterin-dependent oxidoreductase [Nocardioides sp.]